MRRLYLALFAIGLVVYGVAAGGRIWHQSGAPHFVYQADAWLHGTIAIAANCGDPGQRRCNQNETPLPADDWATVETVELTDGRTVAGRRLVTTKFKTLAGDEYVAADVRAKPVKLVQQGTQTCAPIAGGLQCWAANEPAEVVTLPDGTDAAGRRLKKFRLLDGSEVPESAVAKSIGYTAYVSFPFVPSLLMIPSAAISGRAGNDVIPTLLIAALILPLLLLVLRRLAEAGLSKRSVRDDLWLVGMLAFGSVMFYASIQGKVWFTAHVVGVALALVYAWASIEARHPIIAGLALGAEALTRTSMAFMFPLFVFEAWRMAAKLTANDVPANASGSINLRDGRRAMLRALRRPMLEFAAPIVAFAIIGMLYNYARFESPTEFGHTWLALGNRQPVRQQYQIEQWGLANVHYLGRNLAVAFTLLPDLLPRAPWVQISGHGLAMWITTPALLLVVWPRTKGPLHRALWLTVLLCALPSLLYMNSGWVQFGYRFSLDYLVFLVMLIALGDRPLGRVAKTLIVIGVVVNLFGAYSFDREWQYYKYDPATYGSVVAN